MTMYLTTPSHFPTFPLLGSLATQRLVYYDNDVWVDEAKAAFAANKKNTEKLQVEYIVRRLLMYNS